MTGPQPEKTHIARSFKHDHPLLSCRFDPTGKYVFAGTRDNRVVRWDLASDTKFVLAGHESWVRAIAFSKDGAMTLSGGYDGRILWWSTPDEKAEPLRTIEAHDGWVRAIDVSPDGTLLASAGNDCKVKLFRVADGSLVREMDGHPQHVYSVLFHPDGKSLLSGGLEGQVIQWDVETGELVRRFDAQELHIYHEHHEVHYGGVRSMAFSPDAKQLACSGLHNATDPLANSQQPLVLLFNWETQEKLPLVATKDKLQGIGWRILYHPEGFLIGISGGPVGFLLFFRPGEQQEFHKLKVGNTVYDVDLHPDGVQLATAHEDGQVHISRMTDIGTD